MVKSISASYVRSILDYKPDTGVFTWRYRSDVPKEWNTRHAGKIAGCIERSGYIQIAFNELGHRAHRLAWLIMTGEWPEFEVDHRDTDRSNNKWGNLRQSTHAQNCLNSSIRKDNISRIKGVSWCSRDNVYVVTLMKNKKIVFKKNSKNFSDAVNAITEARKKHHGEFSRAA